MEIGGCWMGLGGGVFVDSGFFDMVGVCFGEDLVAGGGRELGLFGP